MKTKTQRCAGASCRNMILAEDVRIKIGKFTYCEECKIKKEISVE